MRAPASVLMGIGRLKIKITARALGEKDGYQLRIVGPGKNPLTVGSGPQE